MKNFNLYFTWGIDHILTWEALDHLLFVASLCLRYEWKQYKKLLILITAFTIGHTITLIVSSFGLFTIKNSITEFLIALTIMATAISNIWVKDASDKKKMPFIFLVVLSFGMIHGLGFAYALTSMVGRQENIFWPLLAFNSGIEIAQALLSLIFVTISLIFVRVFKMPYRAWLLFTSGIIFGLALQMALERNPF